MVLKICISDGNTIIIDGFDEISFYNKLPIAEITRSGYSWQKDHYNELMNKLCAFNFIGISRHEPKNELSYQKHSFAFQNEDFSSNKTMFLRTNCITTIINMYD